MNFLDIGPKYAKRDEAKNVILKIPYEFTTTYLQGCKYGPDSILEASAHVELFDEEFAVKPHFTGITTAEIYDLDSDHETNLKNIGLQFLQYLNEQKFVIGLGGEHSITIGIFNSIKDVVPNLSVLQFDAHADLRSYFAGSYYNHACVMRRIHESTPNIAQLGLRGVGSDEYSYIKKNSINAIFARDLLSLSTQEVVDRALSTLTPNVYITFDVDFFSTSVITSTGTPEPGGLGWYRTLEILRGIFESCNVVGMDIVELIGNETDKVSPFNAALLAKKCITYKHFAKKKELTNDLYI